MITTTCNNTSVMWYVAVSFYTHVRKVGRTPNFFWHVYNDELEKQLFIEKTVEVG